MNRAWGIDISGWNVPAPDYKTLVKQGASFAIIKASMGGGISTTAVQQAKECREAGVPFIGIYHWADPIHRKINDQMQHIDKMITAINPDFISIDNEQWWGSWNAYYQFQRGDISANAVPKLSPNWISDFGEELTTAVYNKYKLTTLNYTADWFIDSYSPSMRQWLRKFPTWMAWYPIRDGKFDTWETFYNYINNTNPVLSVKNDWYLWQFADRRRLPGFPARYLDLNVFNGTPDKFKQFIGHEIPNQPKPPVENPYYEEYICYALLGMIVRDSPSGKDVKYRISYLQRFNVYEKIVTPAHVWGRIHPTNQHWIALSWSKRV